MDETTWWPHAADPGKLHLRRPTDGIYRITVQVQFAQVRQRIQRVAGLVFVPSSEAGLRSSGLDGGLRLPNSNISPISKRLDCISWNKENISHHTVIHTHSALHLCPKSPFQSYFISFSLGKHNRKKKMCIKKMSVWTDGGSDCWWKAPQIFGTPACCCRCCCSRTTATGWYPEISRSWASSPYLGNKEGVNDCGVWNCRCALSHTVIGGHDGRMSRI